MVESEEDLEVFLEPGGSQSFVSRLHGGNWIIVSPDRARLQHLQDELGGEFVPDFEADPDAAAGRTPQVKH